MVRISVVIPTRDRPGPLATCLAGLAVDFPADAETVVVSDGGAVDLGTVVAPFTETLRLRVLSIEHAGPAAARNRGLEVARGDVVAFIDDDCRPRPGWLAALAAGVVVCPPRAVAGITLNGLPANPYADAAQLVLDLLSRYDRAMTRRERLLPSNNFAFPTTPLRGIGGFDERFRTAEDRELCRRWAGAGFDLGRVPAAVVEHDARLDLLGFVTKFFAYGRGAALFHGSGERSSLRESARFHFRLPGLVAPEVRRRGPVRGMALVALLALWQAANLAGFVCEWRGRRRADVPERAEDQRRAR
jgi:glycosyltransferase involved in cell wall biosynthesis